MFLFSHLFLVFLYIFFLPRCTTSEVLYVSNDGSCEEDNLCKNADEPCSFLCPFLDNNKRLDSYKSVIITLKPGVYDLTKSSLIHPYNSVALITVDDLEITIIPSDISTETILKGFPNPPISKEFTDSVSVNGSIFYLTGLNLKIRFQNFTIENLLPPNDFYTTLKSDISILSSEENLDVESIEFLFMNVRCTNLEGKNESVVLPILKRFIDHPESIESISNLNDILRHWKIKSLVLKYSSFTNVGVLLTIYERGLNEINIMIEGCTFFEQRHSTFSILESDQISENTYIYFAVESKTGGYNFVMNVIDSEFNGIWSYSTFVFDDLNGNDGFLNVNFQNSNFTGGQALIQMFDNRPTLSIDSCDISNYSAIQYIEMGHMFLQYIIFLSPSNDGYIGSDFLYHHDHDVHGRNTFFDEKVSCEVNVEIKNSIFHQCRSGIIDLYFGRVYQVNQSVFVNNCTFEDNNGHPNTAVFATTQLANYLNNYIYYSFSDSFFRRNVGFESVFQIILPTSAKSKKTPFCETGSILCYLLHVKDCVFENNHIHGSLLYFFYTGFSIGTGDNSGDFVIEGSKFLNNIADDTSIVKLKRSEAWQGMYLDYLSFRLYLLNCRFESNEVHGPGGTVFVSHFKAGRSDIPNVLWINSTDFVNNQAKLGGCLYLENVKVDVEGYLNCNGNKADFGGGVYLINSTLTSATKKNSSSTFPNDDDDVTMPQVSITENYARISGGGVYQNGDVSFNQFQGKEKKHILIQNNKAWSPDENNDLDGSPARIELDSSVKNKCFPLGGSKAWSCYFPQIQVINSLNKTTILPSIQSQVIVVTIYYRKRSGEIADIIKLNTDYRDPDGFHSIYVSKKNEKRKNNDVLPLHIQFLGNNYRTELHFTQNPGFPTALVVSLSVLIIVLVLLGCVFLCLMACLCFGIIDAYQELRRKKTKELIRNNFGNFSQNDSVHSIYLSMLRTKKRMYGETSNLIEDDEIMNVYIDDFHVFKGSFNGEGVVYFVNNFKYYPVFKGSFVEGKRSGFGTELFVHQIYDEEEIHSEKFWDKYKRFEGVYKDGRRNGKGTEYTNQGKHLVGVWKDDQLCNVIWNNLDLNIIDLGKDVKRGKMIYPPPPKKTGKPRITSSCLYEGTYKKKNCVVKVFTDIERIGVEKHLSRARILEENLKILSMYKHPNVVQILGWSGVLSSETRFFKKEFGYAMEFCDYNLKQFLALKKDQIDRNLKINILFQIAVGMEYVHRVCGLIHRDIKANNILIVDKLITVKICDFDFSTRDEEGFRPGSQNENTAAGSPFHIAPECLTDRRFTSKSDIYSFGILMFEVFEDRVGDPFGIIRDRQCHVCKEKLEKTGKSVTTFRDIVDFMKDHYNKCNIRPKIWKDKTSRNNKKDDDKKEEEEEEECEGEDEVDEVFPVEMSWMYNLMERCWHKDSTRRPSFGKIVEIFKSNEVRVGRKYISSVFDFERSSINL